MPKTYRVALVGDFNASAVAHQAIPVALQLAGACGVWTHTSSITNAAAQLADFDGIWCVPASPYANTEGALDAIRFARESGRPFLGTCGGFQHAVIEYARNVCGLSRAEHAETAPGAEAAVISPLSCALVETGGEIFLSGGRVRAAYGPDSAIEGYHCSYGFNPAFKERILSGDLTATAFDSAGEVRAVELRSHSFYVATLFQPERRALTGELPPLVGAFIEACRASN
jgi:CTP synthase (UTP-ammonia lyase)